GTLEDIVVADDHGVPVRLGDIAEIEAAVREDFIRTAANGETAVLIGVSRRPHGDTIAIADGVRQRLGELERAHPEYAFSIFYDQADLVRAAIRSVRDSIVLGLVLAVGTIFVFIADLRATLVAAAVIPAARSEEHTSELQSRGHLVCRLLLEKKKPILLRAPPRRPTSVGLLHRPRYCLLYPAFLLRQ